MKHNDNNIVYLALGANLRMLAYYDIESLLNSVKYRLSKLGIRTIVSSNNWITKPIPKANLPVFINCVIKCLIVEKRMHDPLFLLKKIKKLEKKLGRKYNRRNISRVIDIDILDYKGMVLNNDLILPHPRMHIRYFVLKPLSSINKNWVHPVYKKKIDYLCSKIKPDQQIRLKL